MRTSDALFWGLLLGGGALGYAALQGNVLPSAAGASPGSSRPPGHPASSSTPPAKRGKQITSSKLDSALTVRESPASLLEQARKMVPSLSLEEYTAARLAASEYGRGNPAELAAVIDATLNGAKRRGRSLFDHLTRGARGTFGKQGSDSRGGRRPASTRQDPREIHVAAAVAVMRGELRGTSRGAVRYFSPRTQHAMWNKGNVNHCDPLTLLRRWSFDLPQVRKGGQRVRPLDSRGRALCQLDKSRGGRDTLAWVGPIGGVDATRLMLMAPMKRGELHTKRHDAARAVVAAVVGKEGIA